MSAKTKRWLFWTKIIMAGCIVTILLIFFFRADDPNKFAYLGIIAFVGAVDGFMIWALNHGGLVEDAKPVSTEWGGAQIDLDRGSSKQPPPDYPDFPAGVRVPRVPVLPSRSAEEEGDRPHKVYELD